MHLPWFKRGNELQIQHSFGRVIQLINQQTLHFRDLVSGYTTSGRPGRNTYQVYDYPKKYDFRLGYEAIRREGIANRVAVGVPKSCWRNGFELTESQAADTGEPETILDEQVAQLRNLDLFGRLERADVLNRIGNFSVLLVGVPDGKELNEEVGRAQGDAFSSLYFRPFAYDGVTVSQWDMDQFSPRYGMPELYQLQVMGRGDDNKAVKPQAIVAHYSRVVHMVENPLDSDVEGISAIEPVYNRIKDLDKVLGGSAEAYFRNARGKTAFEVAPEFAASLLSDPTAKERFDEAARKFTDDWQDQIVVAGAKAHSLDTPHDPPHDTAKSILWEISGYTGIPLRVLTGEGSGQLAGSEDRLAYNALVNDRQTHVCAPWVRDVMSILQAAGMVELPDTYGVNWPLDEALNAIDQAEIENKRANTLKTLTEAASSPGGDSIDLDSALEFFGLGDIETDEMEETDDGEQSDPTGDPPGV